VSENVQSIIEQLEVGHSEALTAFLEAMAHFRNYIFGNVLLIARQKPDARNVAGMWAWNHLERRVKLGEKGIVILAQMVAEARKDETKSDGENDNRLSLLGFRRMYVWNQLSHERGGPDLAPHMEARTGALTARHFVPIETRIQSCAFHQCRISDRRAAAIDEIGRNAFGEA
jgi:hypothetical protein